MNYGKWMSVLDKEYVEMPNVTSPLPGMDLAPCSCELIPNLADDSDTQGRAP